MKKFILSVALAMVAGVSFGQNNAYYKAQEKIDKGELTEAEAILEAALTNPKTTKFAMMYNQAGEVQARIFDPELKNAAQGLPFDTMKFVTHMDKSILYFTKSHEEDIKPNDKGKVKPKFIAQNKSRIKAMLDYYNYAAMFMNASGKLDESIVYFEKYINLPKNPVFSQAETDSIYESKKTVYAQTRFNIALLTYQLKKWDKCLELTNEALKDTLGTTDLFKIKQQCCLELKDSAAWLATMQEAVMRTNNAMFSQNLLYYYVTNKKTAEAERMATEIITKSPDSKMAWYMKGCVELNLKNDYAEARKCFEKALAIDPNFVDANSNMAASYINEAYQKRLSGVYKFIGTNRSYTQKEKPAYEKELADFKSFYEKALPYLEKVRELAPDQPRIWASSLQQCYYNLGQTDKAKEMDALLESSRK